jgi:hypothetical protein
MRTFPTHALQVPSDDAYLLKFSECETVNIHRDFGIAELWCKGLVRKQ